MNKSRLTISVDTEYGEYLKSIAAKESIAWNSNVTVAVIVRRALFAMYGSHAPQTVEVCAAKLRRGH